MRKVTMRKLDYNAPVILTFAILAVGIFILGQLIPAFIGRYFLVRGSMSLLNPLDYFRLISHVLGHGSWQHLFGNLTLILLLGPILEEKYSSTSLLIMIVVTALVTGILNVVFFSSGLFGASGIVFMLIILVSIVDLEAGSIPLTFVLVVIIFLGGEFIDIFRNDNISQMSHIIGGAVGAFFGFVMPHGDATEATVNVYR
jgi:membrane associated rhomboid family serine protease